MKKIISCFLAVIFAALSIFSVSAAEYDEEKLFAGLNPIAIQYDDNTFKYVIAASGLEKMTNGDMTIHYNNQNISVASIESKEDFAMFEYNDTGECVKISFIYDENCGRKNAELLAITFIGNAEKDIPQTELTNIAGTYIRNVAKPVIIKKSSSGQNETILGDVDGDKKITAADARLALRIAAKLEKASAEQYKAADVNGDGIVTSADARKILRHSANLESLY